MPTRTRILITGASSGLGAELARQYAALGRDLALCARRIERLEELRGEITAQHPSVRVAIRQLDVDDHDAVFTVLRELADELGGLDRVVVNAGLGKGARIGTGRFDINRETLTTNLVSALAQCEAAVQIFRAANAGHLVVVSSLSALRGMPGTMTAYAASKAGLATLAEGIRAELIDTPIRVTTLFPGYIRSEMNERVAQRTPLMAGTEKGVRSMLHAIEGEVPEAIVPPWPWRLIAPVLRHAPLRMLKRIS
jgi:short-subunit dehydrogenase